MVVRPQAYELCLKQLVLCFPVAIAARSAARPVFGLCVISNRLQQCVECVPCVCLVFVYAYEVTRGFLALLVLLWFSVWQTL
jgi:hypothetical protein